MANQRLLLDGVDFTGCIASMKWTRNDIDASGSGRDKSGTMRRGRVASKAKLSFTCRPLTHAEMAALNAALAPETVSVGYLDPLWGLRTSEFYGSSVDAAVWQSGDGDTTWEGATFNLVEV